VRKIAAIFAVGFAVLLAIAAGTLFVLLRAPYAGYSDPVVVYIEPKTRSSAIAEDLEARGVIQSRWLFLAARALRLNETLMAGEYRFEQPLSVWGVFDAIAEGRVYYHPFTIPEGYNRFEIAGVLDEMGFARREEFLKACKQTSLIHDLLPEATNLEGFLFPDTYYIAYPFVADKIAAMMVQRFREVLQEVSAGSTSPLTAGETVILASLIEKETSIPAERPLVSSVFHNRLEKGMLLQCDPTVIYGLVLAKRYQGELLRGHLEQDHPYNTYVRPGLPPGPIANPGRASLQAAFHPAETDLLFFVAQAKGVGRHVFNETAQGHNRAVSAYRRGRSR
jgi:UPF0755 protein